MHAEETNAFITIKIQLPQQLLFLNSDDLVEDYEVSFIFWVLEKGSEER